MIIAYTEIDKIKRKESKQIQSFWKQGAKHVFIEQDRETRAEFIKALNLVKTGDYLMVETIDQLGRNHEELVKVIKELIAKEAGLLITSIPLLNQPLDDPKFTRFVEELLLQLLKNMKERETLERRRKQAEGIRAAKEKGVYKGRPALYAADAKDPAKRLAYHSIVKMLKAGESVQKIAREHEVTRTTVYRIKQELDTLETGEETC